MPINDNAVFVKTPLQQALGGMAVSSDFVGGVPVGATIADGDVVDQATITIATTGTATIIVGPYPGHPGVIQFDCPAPADEAYARYGVIEPATGNTIHAVAVVNSPVPAGPDIALGLAFRQLALPGTVGADRAQIVFNQATTQWRAEFDDGAALNYALDVAPASGWTRLEIVMSPSQTDYFINGALVASWPDGFASAAVQCGAVSGADIGGIDVDLFAVATGGLNR